MQNTVGTLLEGSSILKNTAKFIATVIIMSSTTLPVLLLPTVHLLVVAQQIALMQPRDADAADHVVAVADGDGPLLSSSRRVRLAVAAAAADPHLLQDMPRLVVAADLDVGRPHPRFGIDLTLVRRGRHVLDADLDVPTVPVRALEVGSDVPRRQSAGRDVGQDEDPPGRLGEELSRFVLLKGSQLALVLLPSHATRPLVDNGACLISSCLSLYIPSVRDKGHRFRGMAMAAT